MELVTTPAQLAIGARIAIASPTYNWLGVVDRLTEDRIHYIDENGKKKDFRLSDAGVTNPRAHYQTFLVTEEETAELLREDEECSVARAALREQSAARFSGLIKREDRNQGYRDALSQNGSKPLSGAAGLIIGL